MTFIQFFVVKFIKADHTLIVFKINNNLFNI